MRERNSRPRARTEDRHGRTSWFAGRSDRVAILALGAMLALTPIVGTTALAGSGGTGPGGGGERGGTSDRFERMWDGMSRKNKRWAHRTSECESGERPKVHGGGGSYHGAFQFMNSTWRSAPKSPGGDAHTTPGRPRQSSPSS